MNQIRGREEREGHNQLIRKDSLRKSLEEPDLFCPEIKSIQELQCRLLGMRASNWFPRPLPPGRAEINIIQHVGEQAGYQNTWEWLRGGEIVFYLIIRLVTNGLFDLTTERGKELGGFPKAPPVHQVLHIYHFMNQFRKPSQNASFLRSDAMS